MYEGKSQETYLGFIDGPFGVESEDEAATIEDTFIGASPIWLDPNSSPDPSLITCKNCGKRMALLAQVFSPLEDKLYDRVLYIFSCYDTARCSRKEGAIRCIRGICKDPQKMAQLAHSLAEEKHKELDQKLKAESKRQIAEELTKNLFKSTAGSSETTDDAGNGEGATSNPFSSSSNPFSASNPFASTQTLAGTSADKKLREISDVKSSKKLLESLQSKHSPDPNLGDPLHDQCPCYPGYFVYVEKEKFKKNPVGSDLEKYKHLIDDDSEGEPTTGSSRKANKKSSASRKSKSLPPQATKISNMLQDKCFEHFTSIIAHNPGQVLRYQLGGRPLLYSSRDEVASIFSSLKLLPTIPRPTYNPSSARQFELQLMPKAIVDLEQSSNADITFQDIMNGMSWGTIIVCTDIDDFIPSHSYDDNHVAYVEEWCGIQWEDSI